MTTFAASLELGKFDQFQNILSLHFVGEPYATPRLRLTQAWSNDRSLVVRGAVYRFVSAISQWTHRFVRLVFGRIAADHVLYQRSLANGNRFPNRR